MTDPDPVAPRRPEGLGPGLADILRILWSHGCPDGCRVEPSGAAVPPGWAVADDLLVLPSSRASRFIVSDAPGRATAHVLTSHNGIRQGRTALQRRALGLYVGAGLPRRLVADRLRLLAPQPPSDGEGLAAVSFPSRLRAVVGDENALLAVGIRHLEHQHAKPTVQLFTAEGTPAAYAKLGWSPSTAPMVLRETQALRRVARRGLGRAVRAPRLTHDGEWRGFPYLVVEPLPPDIRSLRVHTSPRHASRAVAGEARRSRVSASLWFAEILRRLESVEDDRSSSLAAAARRAATALGAEPVEWDFGAWHGDWTWWNVGEAAGEIHAWDWEHSSDAAPVGFDDLHWSISEDRELNEVPLREALGRSERRLPVPGREGVLFQLAYLVEMAVRSCEVSRHAAGAPIELHPGLLGELHRLTPP